MNMDKNDRIKHSLLEDLGQAVQSLLLRLGCSKGQKVLGTLKDRWMIRLWANMREPTILEEQTYLENGLWLHKIPVHAG